LTLTITIPPPVAIVETIIETITPPTFKTALLDQSIYSNQSIVYNLPSIDSSFDISDVEIILMN
jgi:hypothetical protein